MRMEKFITGDIVGCYKSMHDDGRPDDVPGSVHVVMSTEVLGQEHMVVLKEHPCIENGHRIVRAYANKYILLYRA